LRIAQRLRLILVTRCSSFSWMKRESLRAIIPSMKVIIAVKRKNVASSLGEEVNGEIPKKANIAQHASPNAAPMATLIAVAYRFCTASWNISRFTGPMGIPNKNAIQKHAR